MDLIKNIFDNKLVRFFLVGGLNSAFGYGLFAFLIFIGLHYIIAGLIATILGILFTFKTIGIIVFNNSNNWIIFKFLGFYGINYVISMSLLTLLERSGFDMFVGSWLYRITDLLIFRTPKTNACIGAAILILPMGLFAYTLNHRFVFAKPKLLPPQDIKES
jgi:putative flippase GtrA